MALNFCSARLKTQISTSAVSCEGHDVTNLLSGVPALQNKGFMAEGFCKPPVSVHLKFFCNVDINHIILWVQLGCQKSNGLELLAAQGNDVCGDKSEKERPSPSPNSVVKVRIGSCKINNECGVLFQKYNCWVSPKLPKNFLKRFFTTSAATVLRNCSELEIKIFSTANSSVPSLKKLEVWGRPGRLCPEDLKHNVYSWWTQPSGSPKNVPKIINSPKDGRNSPIAPSTAIDFSEIVPEEFFDPITLNIMAIPMTLPSGKAVDQSTLEKFETAEANWGRGPSDPFTGVPFSQSIYPIPDVALKSRIDRFLMEKGHLAQFKGVGRTVGREKRDSNQFTPVLSECDKESACREISGGASSSGSQSNSSVLCSISSLSQSTIPVNCHRKASSHSCLISNDGEDTSKNSVACRTQMQRGLKRKRNVAKTPTVPVQGIEGSHMTNHENAVEDSLDCALQSVLCGLPSFIKINDHSLGETSGNTAKYECSSCPSKDCLFSLPCQHLLCRACLVKMSSKNSMKMNCEVCHNHYNSSDVVRFHS